MSTASVIICTHNPRRDYLERVLQALRTQTAPLDSWDLIVVDNRSDCPVAEAWDLSWHPRARHLREERLGLAYARQCAMRETDAELLIFVDDDNVLAPNYLAEALRIAEEWPQLGVWGGSIVPEFEVEPPEHLRNYLHFLALREVPAARWSNVVPCDEAEPWGAGMCLRAAVASAYREYFGRAGVRLTGRSGKDLISGEDTEICYVACSIGLGMGLFPGLRVTHLIPAARLSEAHLLRLIEGLTTSYYLLGFKWRATMPRSPFRMVELLRSLKNIATRRDFERRVYLSRRRALIRARALIASGPDRAHHA